MIQNYQNLQMTSATTSLKILLQGEGLITIPSTSSTVTVTNTVFHNYGSSELLWQVGGTLTIGVTVTEGIITPWATDDGQYNFVATIDSNNLYISGIAQTAGSPTASAVISYAYRILVP